MTVIAYYKDTLYADRRIVTGSEGVGYSALGNRTKITIADNKTYALLKDGELLDKRTADELANSIFELLFCHDKTLLPELIRKFTLKQIVNTSIGFNGILFAVKGKCLHVSKIGVFRELNRDQLFVSGSGQSMFYCDHLLGYPVDKIFDRISKSTSLVSKEFDSINIDTDLVEYAKPLLDYKQD